jgi:hypothetical protein
VYVDDTGEDTTTESAEDDQLVVEADAEIYEVEENYDFDGDGHNDTGTDERDAEGSDTGSDQETITVDSPDGDFSAGKPEYDSDGNGTNDTAILTGSDGTTYAFTDADGDGDADTAVAIEADGDVTVAEHTGDEEWTVVEEGHLNSDGGYERDTTTSGSDAVWAEAQ